MSCRHCASQLASFGRLLVFGPWAAQPSVESAGGMEFLPRWTAEGCAPAATSTTWPLCGTSSDCYWCRFEKQSHHTSFPLTASLPLVLSVRSTNIDETCCKMLPLLERGWLAGGEQHIVMDTRRNITVFLATRHLVPDVYAQLIFQGKTSAVEPFNHYPTLLNTSHSERRPSQPSSHGWTPLS